MTNQDELERKIKEKLIDDMKKDDNSSALVGREQIARYFIPTMTKSQTHYFFKKHGAELRDSNITHRIRIGNPQKTIIFAFPKHLRQWVMKKSSKGEIL